MSQQEYVVKRRVAPRDVCDKALSELGDLKPVFETSNLLQYRPTETCSDIARLAIQAFSSDIANFNNTVKPVTINVAKLRKIETDRITGTPATLYIVVALSRLERASGWYTFFRTGGTEETEEIANELDTGDAMLWRGECVAKPGDGEGGLVLMIMLR